LWAECDSLPLEVGELAPGFRMAVGWQDPWLVDPSPEGVYAPTVWHTEWSANKRPPFRFFQLPDVKA